MRPDRGSRYSDSCSSDIPGWLLRNRERDAIRQYLLSAELVKQCLGISKSQVDETLSKVAASRISIPYPIAVKAYLMEHVDLLDILIKACDSATARFGEASELTLQLYRDPETDDKYVTLYVRQSEYPDDFLDSLHAIYAEYAIELSNKSGWFQVTTDFAMPK